MPVNHVEFALCLQAIIVLGEGVYSLALAKFSLVIEVRVMDRLHDRGNIKWSTMMLPEHRQLLIHLKEAQQDVMMKDLTEDKLKEIDQVIRQSLAQGEEIILTYYYRKRYHRITGFVEGYDPLQRQIIIKGRANEQKKIDCSRIIDAVSR
jgi:hypothetical protein